MTPTRPSELLRIRVVRRSGSLIGPARAALRFAVLTIPWTLNGATFGLDIALPAPLQVVADGLVALIVFGGTLSSLYLFVFNRRTRQSLHDLVADTFVVDAHAAAPPAGRVSRVHLGIVGAICVAAMVLPLAMIKWVATDAAAMKTLWQTVQSTPGVGSAIVSADVTKVWLSVGGTTREPPSTCRHPRPPARQPRGSGEPDRRRAADAARRADRWAAAAHPCVLWLRSRYRVLAERLHRRPDGAAVAGKAARSAIARGRRALAPRLL
jgi:hypothetical protein